MAFKIGIKIIKFIQLMGILWKFFSVVLNSNLQSDTLHDDYFWLTGVVEIKNVNVINIERIYTLFLKNIFRKIFFSHTYFIFI